MDTYTWKVTTTWVAKNLCGSHAKINRKVVLGKWAPGSLTNASGLSREQAAGGNRSRPGRPRPTVENQTRAQREIAKRLLGVSGREKPPGAETAHRSGMPPSKWLLSPERGKPYPQPFGGADTPETRAKAPPLHLWSISRHVALGRRARDKWKASPSIMTQKPPRSPSLGSPPPPYDRGRSDFSLGGPATTLYFRFSLADAYKYKTSGSMKGHLIQVFKPLSSYKPQRQLSSPRVHKHCLGFCNH